MDSCRSCGRGSPARSTLLSFSSLTGSGERIVYLDDDDNIDSVYNKVCSDSRFPANSTFHLLTSVFSYDKHIRPGRYDVGSGAGALTVFRNLRNGNQTPTRLTIPVLRTTRDLADLLGRELHAPADSFYAALTNPELLSLYGKRRKQQFACFCPIPTRCIGRFRPRRCWHE